VGSIPEQYKHLCVNMSVDGRFGVVVGINTRLHRKMSRVRFPHSANICVHEHVVLGLGVSM
jgi:hypothetical protein